MQNKKGKGLSTNAIILIGLGVVILFGLVLLFALGVVGDNNVEEVVEECASACELRSDYDFCSKSMELMFRGSVEGLTSGENYKCIELVDKGLGVEACSHFVC
jgi:hypothetical protein